MITSAHCFYYEDKITLRPIKKFRVHLGDFSDGKNGNQVFSIQKKLEHEGFNHSTYMDDLALVKLNKPVVDLMPICLPPLESDFRGYWAHVAGNEGCAKETTFLFRPDRSSEKIFQKLRNRVCQEAWLWPLVISIFERLFSEHRSRRAGTNCGSMLTDWFFYEHPVMKKSLLQVV